MEVRIGKNKTEGVPHLAIRILDAKLVNGDLCYAGFPVSVWPYIYIYLGSTIVISMNYAIYGCLL